MSIDYQTYPGLTQLHYVKGVLGTLARFLHWELRYPTDAKKVWLRAARIHRAHHDHTQKESFRQYVQRMMGTRRFRYDGTFATPSALAYYTAIRLNNYDTDGGNTSLAEKPGDKNLAIDGIYAGYKRKYPQGLPMYLFKAYMAHEKSQTYSRYQWVTMDRIAQEEKQKANAYFWYDLKRQEEEIPF